MKNHAVKAAECPNCQQALNGENYCPHCGQKNDSRRITFWHFVSESLSNTFAFDGRVFHTLYQLFRFPGRVAAQYSEGKRMRYMNPVRLYFLSSLLLLFIIEISLRDSPVFKSDEDIEPAKLELSLDDLENHSWQPSEEIAGGDRIAPLEADANLFDKLEVMSAYQLQHPHTTRSAVFEDLAVADTQWNHFLWQQAEKIATYDEEEFNNYLLSKMFWVLFLFLPILALLLKILYIRRDFYYPEHLFFTFYNQAVFFMLISLALLLPAGSTSMFFAVSIYALYLFLAQRRFYRQAFGKTLLKFILLNSAAIFLFAIFLLFSVLVVFILK